MDDADSPWTAIDKRLEGQPVTMGTATVQPVAQVKGRRIKGGGEQGGGSAVLVQLEPVEVIVTENGQERTIPTAKPQAEPLRGIVMAGGAVAAGCLAVMVVAHRFAKKSVKRHTKEVQ